MPQTFENQMTQESVEVLPGDPLPGIQSIVLQQLCNSQPEEPVLNQSNRR